jgi:hypothetical protein
MKLQTYKYHPNSRISAYQNCGIVLNVFNMFASKVEARRLLLSIFNQ